VLPAPDLTLFARAVIILGRCVSEAASDSPGTASPESVGRLAVLVPVTTTEPISGACEGGFGGAMYTLFTFPSTSGSVGSCSTNIHCPSTINLYAIFTFHGNFTEPLNPAGPLVSCIDLDHWSQGQFHLCKNRGRLTWSKVPVRMTFVGS
jgi:hypothetical protein